MVLKAVYENGVFRPLQPITSLQDREEVHVAIRPGGRAGLVPPTVTGAEARAILEQFAGSLSPDEADEMTLAIETEFECAERDE
ncbi:MAG TPA: antitoxin family protein [Armatimonadota bacterium]|nr:antitoxin family protein [Armatimonadota bacterium]